MISECKSFDSPVKRKPIGLLSYHPISSQSTEVPFETDACCTDCNETGLPLALANNIKRSVREIRIVVWV